MATEGAIWGFDELEPREDINDERGKGDSKVLSALLLCYCSPLHSSRDFFLLEMFLMFNTFLNIHIIIFIWFSYIKICNSAI